MDPIGTLLLALSALIVLDLAAPHLAGYGRPPSRSSRRAGSHR